MKRDVYKEVTDKIVCDLEEGVRAWVKPWDAEHAAGRITRPLRSNGIPYQGINILMLWMCAMEQDYSAPIWMTFKQARELDGHVRKGEKGSLVVYFNTMTKAGEDANGDEIEHKIPFLRNYSVFNVEQIDGLPEHYYATKADAPKLDPVARNEPLDGFFAATGASIRHGGNRAYYAIGEDRIQMPVFETFREAGSYYATLGHETVHWTRHPSRLARDFGRKRWGDEGYAMEELVAELGSAFLCADLHITPEVREDHAAYIDNWLDVLKSDKRAIFHAAAHAQKATDFLHQQQKPEAGRAGPEDKIPLPPPEKSATFFPTAERSGIKEMSELEEFKTAINLTEYAAAQGFELDCRKTSRNSVFMRHPGGDKIIIARELDGHWVYCSVTDESRGSIIDLVQDLQGGSLGDVRKELRPWIGKGGAVSRPPVKTYAPSVEPTSKDRQAVVREYEQMQPVNRLPYLEQVRGIPATVLSSPRFAGKISMDRHANAVFPHRDKDGVCGFELKNRNFTGFAKGGEKGLWFSVANKVDTRLVFAESGIDAISYAILYPEGAARYASTGGKMNPNQPALIQASIEKMPEGSAIIAAMDNDPDGRKLAGEIEQIVKATGRNDLVFRQHTPAEEGADWNNLLKAHIQKAPAGPLFG